MNTLRIPLVAVAILLNLNLGCGPGIGQLTGKVTVGGKPVVLGTVSAIGSDGVARYGQIQPDGTYKIEGIPGGEVKIVVVSPNPADMGNRRSAGKGEDARAAQAGDTPVSPELAKQWIAVPAEAGDPAKTKLKTTVGKGTNTFNIEL
jgi:hypothetical protein